jgi:hypothetical protein
MGKAEADWKEQRQQHAPDWLTAGVALLLAALYAYLWLLDGQAEYLAITAVLLAWVGVFFTRYWQPILYLFVAIFVASLTVLWIVRGVWQRPVFLVAVVLDVVFLLLVVYLFATEERAE